MLGASWLLQFNAVEVCCCSMMLHAVICVVSHSSVRQMCLTPMPRCNVWRDACLLQRFLCKVCEVCEVPLLCVLFSVPL
jgi:hypothetical protein